MKYTNIRDVYNLCKKYSLFSWNFLTFILTSSITIAGFISLIDKQIQITIEILIKNCCIDLIAIIIFSLLIKKYISFSSANMRIFSNYNISIIEITTILLSIGLFIENEYFRVKSLAYLINPHSITLLEEKKMYTDAYERCDFLYESTELYDLKRMYILRKERILKEFMIRNTFELNYLKKIDKVTFEKQIELTLFGLKIDPKNPIYKQKLIEAYTKRQDIISSTLTGKYIGNYYKKEIDLFTKSISGNLPYSPYEEEYTYIENLKKSGNETLLRTIMNQDIVTKWYIAVNQYSQD